MFNKRLLSICDSSKKWIGLTVLMNWISIICNIALILFIGTTVDKLMNGNLNLNVISTSLFIIAMLSIRFVANFMSTKFSLHSSSEVKKTLRSTIYEKLLSLGVNYTDAISTSSTVQIAVDGVEQLEIYFGRFMPQLFYSLLAPLTLFAVMSFISFKTAIVLLICVPLIPMTIMAVMKIAKKLLSKYWGVYTDLGDSFLENLQGLTTLKIFDIDEDKNKEMNDNAEHFRKITMKVLSMQLNSITIMDLIAFGGSAIGILIAIAEFRAGLLTAEASPESFAGISSEEPLSAETYSIAAASGHTKYTYDDAGRLKTKEFVGSTYTLDEEKGSMTAAADSFVISAFEYDANDNLIKEIDGEEYGSDNAKGKTYTYKITNIYTQPKVGKIAIYRNYDKTTLTLITCTNHDSTTQTIYIAELESIE